MCEHLTRGRGLSEDVTFPYQRLVKRRCSRTHPQVGLRFDRPRLGSDTLFVSERVPMLFAGDGGTGSHLHIDRKPLLQPLGTGTLHKRCESDAPKKMEICGFELHLLFCLNVFWSHWCIADGGISWEFFKRMHRKGWEKSRVALERLAI